MIAVSPTDPSVAAAFLRSVRRPTSEQISFDLAIHSTLGRPAAACLGSDKFSPNRTPAGLSVAEAIERGQESVISPLFRSNCVFLLGSLEVPFHQRLGDGLVLCWRIYGCYSDLDLMSSFEWVVIRMARSSTPGLLPRPPPEGNRSARFRARTSKSSGQHSVSHFTFYGLDPHVPAKYIGVDSVEAPHQKDLANDTA